jgi:uncharacterized protein
MLSRDGGGRELAARAGIGLRAPHVAEVLTRPAAVGWVEVHAENYMGGGPARRTLERVRTELPLSLHGVGLSLGSAAPLDRRHLDRLADLVERFEPALVSEHFAWSVAGGAYLNDLLPVPLDEEALAVTARHVDEVQTRLRRQILVENPSSYLRFTHTTMTETEFLAALVERAGCGLLCDVNNIYVSAHNVGFDPLAYLAAVPAAAVGQIHLAGHTVNDADGHTVLIDDHGARVAPAVWELYARALDLFGAVPTLVEWDSQLPSLSVLLGEAREADRRLARVQDQAHAVAS